MIITDNSITSTNRDGRIKSKDKIGIQVITKSSQSSSEITISVSANRLICRERPAYMLLRTLFRLGLVLLKNHILKNPNIEIRNSKQSENSNIKCSKHYSPCFNFVFWSFGLVSDFVLWISYFASYK